MARSEAERNHRSPDEIERDLEQSRLEISRTIDAIQRKITPGQLASDAYGYVRGNGTEFAKNLGTAAKNNPVPIALMSIGLAWLMMGGRGTPSYLQGGYSRRGMEESGGGKSSFGQAIGATGEYARSAGSATAGAASSAGSSLYRAGQSAGETVSGVGRRVGDMAAGASGRVRQMADDVRDLASEWSEGASGFADSTRERMQRAGEVVQEQTMQMRDSANSLLREQPLVVGALGLAAGALLGAMIPLSRRENEMMGETRDQLLDQAKDVGQQTLGQAAESAKSVANAATEAALDEADRRGLTKAGSEPESGSEGGGVRSDRPLTEQSAAGQRTS